MEQSNVISFNDMEYDVAAKVKHVASYKYCFAEILNEVLGYTRNV